MNRKQLLTVAMALATMGVNAQTNNAPTMGWSSWNTYRVNISDSLIRHQADCMVKTGLKDAGYKYINIDDGFQGGRGADGKLKINPHRFPFGLKPVADYIHSLGLKAGIYSDAGRNTCGNYYDKDTLAVRVGMYEHDDVDARFYFKDMGFDFIKIDYCGGDAKQNTDRLPLRPHHPRRRCPALRPPPLPQRVPHHSPKLPAAMNIQTVRQYCLAKPLATEDSAFGPEGVLFRVYNKIFAYIDLEKPYLVVLKADPDYAIELRDQYRGIQGAFHWNKKYWNEVHFDTDVPDDLILQLIDHSLSEVLRKLPKKTQAEYAALQA